MPLALHDHARAMLLMVVAMLFLPGIDAIAKWLTGAISPGQVALSRFLFQVLFMFPLLLRTSGPWWNRTLWLHAIRGALIAVATLLFFTGITYLPLADAIAIFFVEPMLVTLLSVLLLKETVGWRRLLAVATGFLGALIVIRPTFAEIGWPVLYPVGTAFCFSFYILLTRRMVSTEDPVRLQFFAGVFGLLVMGIAVSVGSHLGVDMLAAVRPTSNQWLLLALLGLIATVCHQVVVIAYRHAPVGVLAPFQYVEIIGATLLGLWLFDDFPDSITWIGIAIIIGSGIYIFHRESRAGDNETQEVIPER